jgi:hypothetical protein
LAAFFEEGPNSSPVPPVSGANQQGATPTPNMNAFKYQEEVAAPHTPELHPLYAERAQLEKSVSQRLRDRYCYVTPTFKATWKRVGYKLLAALPAVTLAPFVDDLSVTLQVAGLFGIVVAFIMPSLLHLTARARALRLGLDITTAYSSQFSGGGCAVAVVAFGAISMGVVASGVVGQVVAAMAGRDQRDR